MASLLKHLTDLIEGGHDIAYAHHADLLSVAKLHYDRGDLETAGRLFEPLLDSNQPGIAQNARRCLSLIHKKRNQWDAQYQSGEKCWLMTIMMCLLL